MSDEQICVGCGRLLGERHAQVCPVADDDMVSADDVAGMALSDALRELRAALVSDTGRSFDRIVSKDAAAVLERACLED